MDHSKVAPAETDLMRAVVDALPVGVVVVDAEGIFQVINAAAQRLLCGGAAVGAADTVHDSGSSYTLQRPDRTELPHEERPLIRALEHGESVDNAELILRRR